jgi:hypothetical protein
MFNSQGGGNAGHGAEEKGGNSRPGHVGAVQETETWRRGVSLENRGRLIGDNYGVGYEAEFSAAAEPNNVGRVRF